VEGREHSPVILWRLLCPGRAGKQVESTFTNLTCQGAGGMGQSTDSFIRETLTMENLAWWY